MNYKILILGCALFLHGCGSTNLTNEQIKRAEELCLGHGGVDYIEQSVSFFHPDYVCNDGVIFRIYNSKMEMVIPTDKGK